jgi:hypothetical protein
MSASSAAGSASVDVNVSSLAGAAGRLGRLPLYQFMHMLQYLTPSDLCRLACVCGYLRHRASDGRLWARLFSKMYPASGLTASSFADWKHVFMLEMAGCAEELVCFHSKVIPLPP